MYIAAYMVGDHLMNLVRRFLPLVITLALLLSSCVTQTVQQGAKRATDIAAQTQQVAGEQPHNPTSAATGEGGASVSPLTTTQPGNLPATGDPDTEAQVRQYTFETGFSSTGGMAFIGVGGEIDGMANPPLQVTAGETIEILLVNGDNIVHNIVLPDFGVKSADVATQGEEAHISFQAGQSGTFEYFCDIPGHKQAGMVGMLEVLPGAEPQAQSDPTAAPGAEAQPGAATAAAAGGYGEGAAATAAAPAPTQPAAAAVDTSALPSIVRHPDDLPAPLERAGGETIAVELVTSEITARLADGVSYTYWTFNDRVPGPMLRVRVGDTLDITLRNPISSTMPHSVDFHAATGPGGGAVYSQTPPGGETRFTFRTLNPGVYVYHCATPSVAHHISNGMYGLIVVEPEEGLEPVDREFYVMQGELYTRQPFGQKGAAEFDYTKMLAEQPEYYVLNGAVGGLTTEAPLRALVGETVRIFFGVGGPNATSAFHIIGEIFDRVFDLGAITSPPLTNVQSILVGPGSSGVVELRVDVPGTYLLVDHALSRTERGLLGYLIVEGEHDPSIIEGTPTEGDGH
jgi:nitrite reductase (NO-forming)